MSCCCDCDDDSNRPGAVVHAPPQHETGAWAAPPTAPHSASHQYDSGGWAAPPTPVAMPMPMPMPGEAPMAFPAAPIVDVQPTPCPPPTLPEPQPAPAIYPAVPLDDDPDSAYCWRQGNYGSVPEGAVRAGHDKDGGPIFVGRAFHEGDMLPAKVVPNKGGAFVAWGGGEHSKDEYEVLCDGDPAWVMASGGSIPEGAVPGGTTSEGERLYIGRVMHDGAFSVGKVQPSHGVCYIPFGGEEVAYGEYEILVGR